MYMNNKNVIYIFLFQVIKKEAVSTSTKHQNFNNYDIYSRRDTELPSHGVPIVTNNPSVNPTPVVIANTSQFPPQILPTTKSNVQVVQKNRYQNVSNHIQENYFPGTGYYSSQKPQEYYGKYDIEFSAHQQKMMNAQQNHGEYLVSKPDFSSHQNHIKQAADINNKIPHEFHMKQTHPNYHQNHNYYNHVQEPGNSTQYTNQYYHNEYETATAQTMHSNGNYYDPKSQTGYYENVNTYHNQNEYPNEYPSNIPVENCENYYYDAQMQSHNQHPSIGNPAFMNGQNYTASRNFVFKNSYFNLN